MRKSRLLGTACAFALTWSVSATTNASIIYNVDRTVGSGSVTGFIETDGTIGVLSSVNITNWEITLSAPNLKGGSPDLIDFATQSQTNLGGTATTATTTQLLFDFSLTGAHFFLLQGGSVNFWCLEIANCTVDGPGEHIGLNSLTFLTSAQSATFTSGNLVFAEVSAVPVPAAVWLFGSGLLGMIGIARHKKAA